MIILFRQTLTQIISLEDSSTNGKIHGVSFSPRNSFLRACIQLTKRYPSQSSLRRTSTVAATFFAVAAFATLVVVLDHEYAPASMSLREEVVAAPSPAKVAKTADTSPAGAISSLVAYGDSEDDDDDDGPGD